MKFTIVLLFIISLLVKSFSRIEGFASPRLFASSSAVVVARRAGAAPADDLAGDDDDDDDDDDLSLEAFQRAKDGLPEQKEVEEEEFDGYDLRDAIFAKWGKCYDVDFNRVESFGFKKVRLLHLRILSIIYVFCCCW